MDVTEKTLYKKALKEWTTYYLDFETYIGKKNKLKVDLAVCQAVGSDPKVFSGLDAVQQMMSFFLNEKPITPHLLMAHNSSMKNTIVF